MLSAILDGLALFDGIATCLRWFGDGLLWLLSPTRRIQIRSTWAARGLMYKYAQVMSWFVALFVALLLCLFLGGIYRSAGRVVASAAYA
jgi:hypothetical protein